MLLKLWTSLDQRPVWQALLLGLALAALIEAVTCLFRFGLGLQSTRDTAWLARFTFGYRIHHGYIGALLLLGAVLPGPGAWRNMLVAVGVGLVVSDLVHHFIVLWGVTGSPEFHIRYTDRG